MAAWGNALGGWRKQKRNARGQFGNGVVGFAKNSVNKRRVAGAAHRSRKKANARAHRARVKGSVKNRGREFVTTAPRRTRQITAGAAAYTLGRSSGSARMQSYGLSMAQRGVKTSAGRTSATVAMSRGLKRSRNRASKDRYLKDIGSSRAKRRAMKLAAGAVVVGATVYALKNKNLEVGVRLGSKSTTISRTVRARGRTAHGSVYHSPGVARFSTIYGTENRHRVKSKLYLYESPTSKIRKKAAERGFVI